MLRKSMFQEREDWAEQEAPNLSPSAWCLGLDYQQISEVRWLFPINSPLGDESLFFIISTAVDSEPLNESAHINESLS